jgi:hypothetical protein
VTLAGAPSPQGTPPFPLTRRAPTTQTPWKLLLSRRRASTLGLPNRSTDGPHTAVTSQRQLAALAPRHTPCAAGNCSRNLPLPSLPSADQTRSTDDSNALATAPKPAAAESLHLRSRCQHARTALSDVRAVRCTITIDCMARAGADPIDPRLSPVGIFLIT